MSFPRLARTTLAKDVAAMTNTEGGVIVYGIGQDKLGRAAELHPFAVSGAAERVTLVAQNWLDEPLTLGSVHSVPSEHGENLGFLVVEVPRSDRAPHFCQGAAWGRTARGNAPLTRRRVGELFARSPGFAEEFGLVVGRPGRVLAKQVAERYQETVFGEPRTTQCYHLVFENDGSVDVFDVTWEWVARPGDKPPPAVPEDPFPLETMPAGVQVRLYVIHTFGTARDSRVWTCWRDTDGKAYEQTWPITF